ncbi:MAG TPA: hypothetical protein VGY56_09635, partial [Verrucomicrobiae bacterium]|nr:hypothetical protein [Verrucomicrobiae bacterium]
AVVRLLIKAGVDVNEVGKESGKRAIELAREKGNCEIIKILKDAGARDRILTVGVTLISITKIPKKLDRVSCNGSCEADK